MIPDVRWLTVLVALAPAGAPAAAGEMPAGLPDFSRAGYRAGREDLPRRKATVNARDHGARGDGKTDDTSALTAAVAAAAEGGGVVLIPEGRYRLTGVVRIARSGVVLRGAGSGKTVLVCPKSLTEIRKPSRSWSWSGGMIEVVPPKGRSETAGAVAAAARAGARTLRVAAAPAPARAGEWLELQWFNDRGADTLLDHIYGGVIPRNRMGRELQTADRPLVRHWVRAESVAGGTVTLAGPLPLDVRPQWRCRLVRRRCLNEVGVEGLSFEFPETPYPGHLKEKGYNAVYVRCLINGWVRDIRTAFADSGIFVNQSRFVTVRDVTLTGRTMHHPLAASWSSDCLFTGWRIEAPHIHGTTLSWAAHHNVFSDGWGRSLAMDAHRAASFENLHTDITIAEAKRPFRSGGSAPRGPHSARRNVYWNVRLLTDTGRPVRITAHREWPLGIFVNFRGNAGVRMQAVRGLKQQVLDLNAAPDIEDLHAWQVRRRRAESKGP